MRVNNSSDGRVGVGIQFHLRRWYQVWNETNLLSSLDKKTQLFLPVNQDLWLI